MVSTPAMYLRKEYAHGIPYFSDPLCPQSFWWCCPEHHLGHLVLHVFQQARLNHWRSSINHSCASNTKIVGAPSWPKLLLLNLFQLFCIKKTCRCCLKFSTKGYQRIVSYQVGPCGSLLLMLVGFCSPFPLEWYPSEFQQNYGKTKQQKSTDWGPHMALCQSIMTKMTTFQANLDHLCACAGVGARRQAEWAEGELEQVGFAGTLVGWSPWP